VKLLVSLHDVTPFHLPRLQRAEALCAALGVDKISFLLIPDYHSLGRSYLSRILSHGAAVIALSLLSGFSMGIHTRTRRRLRLLCPRETTSGAVF
jgi:hypothetical protein